MFRLLSSVNRPLRPHALYSSVYLPVLRKVHRAPFQRNELLSVLTTTAFSSKATKNDSDTQIYYGFEYLIDGVESLRSYKPGGYHPIHIGDQLQGRYRIFNKLGYGAYSTTWLARDEQSNKYVAVKICTADSNASMKEADIISFLTRPHCSLEYNPGQAMIPLIFDRLTIHGPNGEHACYVTEPARASLAGLKKGSFKSLFQLDVARSLAAQLVLAVDYVHSQGYVHGDLHLGNVLLTTQPGFDQLSLEQLYETYGPPDQEKVIRVDEKPLSPGVPTHAIAPKWLGKASEDITRAEARILLSDFGEAFAYPKEQKFVSHAPTVYRPPEARFEPETSLSFASDVWTLACAIWYIIAQRLLFESLFATQDNITREHVEALGLLPPEWWTKWEARGKYFTDDGGPINLDDDDRIRQLDDRFDDSVQYPRTEEGMPAFDARESKAIFDMLRPMLSFRPEHRPTTGRILESEWMVRWALPSFFCFLSFGLVSEPEPSENEDRVYHTYDSTGIWRMLLYVCTVLVTPCGRYLAPYVCATEYYHPMQVFLPVLGLESQSYPTSTRVVLSAYVHRSHRDGTDAVSQMVQVTKVVTSFRIDGRDASDPRHVPTDDWGLLNPPATCRVSRCIIRTLKTLYSPSR